MSEHESHMQRMERQGKAIAAADARLSPTIEIAEGAPVRLCFSWGSVAVTEACSFAEARQWAELIAAELSIPVRVKTPAESTASDKCRAFVQNRFDNDERFRKTVLDGVNARIFPPIPPGNEAAAAYDEMAKSAPRFTRHLCPAELSPGTVGDLCEGHAEIERRVSARKEGTRAVEDELDRAIFREIVRPDGGTDFECRMNRPMKPAPAAQCPGCDMCDEEPMSRDGYESATGTPPPLGEVAGYFGIPGDAFSPEGLERLMAELKSLPCTCGPEFVRLPSGMVVDIGRVGVVDPPRYEGATGNVWIDGKTHDLDAADYAALCERMGV